MRRGAVGETANRLEETDLVEIASPPLPSSVLEAYLLSETLSAAGRPFRISFHGPFEERESDVFLRPGAHADIYELALSMGTELPELRAAASLAYGAAPDEEFMESVIARGSLEIVEGLPFRGEVDEALDTSLDPYLRGITGDSIETGSLLNDLGIGMGREVGSLDEHEESRLASCLALHLVEQGASSGSVDMLLRGRLGGSLGDATELALRTEALCHRFGGSRALSGLISGGEFRNEVEGYVSQVVAAIGGWEAWEGEVFRFFRIENGPALKAMKVAHRELYPDDPVAVSDGEQTYCAGPRSAPLKQTGVKVLDTGDWFVTEASLEELEELY